MAVIKTEGSNGIFKNNAIIGLREQDYIHLYEDSRCEGIAFIKIAYFKQHPEEVIKILNEMVVTNE